MAAVLDLSRYTDAGQAKTEGLKDGVLSADIPGRAKMASSFFDRTTLDKFAPVTFPADQFGRSKFGTGFVDAKLLKDGVLSADAAGRAKMASGFFSSTTLDKFSALTFKANEEGRSKFEPGFINTALVADAAVTPPKLKYTGETYDFSGATALRAKTPVATSDVATKAYVDSIAGGASASWVNYRYVDPVVDAVQGQANTYYIDRGATALGYNVDLDGQGLADIRVVIGGRERFLVLLETDLGHPTNPGDVAVVRSQATSLEGPAAPGSTNAIKLADPLDGRSMWIHYRRKSLAIP